MKATVLPGLFHWNVFQPDRGIDFNGVFWRREGGNVLIDPMPWHADPGAAEFVEGVGGVDWIVVTNRDHWRDTSNLQARFGAKVLAPADAAMSESADVVLRTTADLPAELRDDVDVWSIAGGKTPVELALYLKPLRALLFGDVVRSHESGRLRLLPDEKLADPPRVRSELRALRDLNLVAVLLGDGDSLFCGARTGFLEFLRELG